MKGPIDKQLEENDPHLTLLLRMQREGITGIKTLDGRNIQEFIDQLTPAQARYVQYLAITANRSLWQHLKDNVADWFSNHISLPDWLASRI